MTSIEDYLLYRIAKLEQLVEDHSDGDTSKLQSFRYGISELKLALKELRKTKKVSRRKTSGSR